MILDIKTKKKVPINLNLLRFPSEVRKEKRQEYIKLNNINE